MVQYKTYRTNFTKQIEQNFLAIESIKKLFQTCGCAKANRVKLNLIKKINNINRTKYESVKTDTYNFLSEHLFRFFLKVMVPLAKHEIEIIDNFKPAYYCPRKLYRCISSTNIEN